MHLKQTKLVSVILPFYNEEKYLNICLSSLLDQTYKNFEIIAIDDGSTDHSRAIAEKFSVKLIKQAHRGSGAARNVGVNEARGQIIVFADADMRFDKEYLWKIIKPILEKKAIGTFTKEEYVANFDNIWSRCWNINSGLPFDRRLPVDYPETENAFRAILKSYFIKSNGFKTNEGYTDDSTVSDKLKIKAINAKGAICYHYNPSSLKEVFLSARWIGRSKLFKKSLKTLMQFSFLNSLRISVKYLLRKAPFAVVFFKLVYDAGVFTGIFMNKGKTFK